MVEPVGGRDANLDALRFGDLKGLEDRQIAAKIVRRLDIGPDGLTSSTKRRSGWCLGRNEATGVVVLTLFQTLSWIARNDGLQAILILVGAIPYRGGDLLRLPSAGRGEGLQNLSARILQLLVVRIHVWRYRLVWRAVLIRGVPGDLPAIDNPAQQSVAVNRPGQLVTEGNVEDLGVVVLQGSVVGVEVEWVDHWSVAVSIGGGTVTRAQNLSEGKVGKQEQIAGLLLRGDLQ